MSISSWPIWIALFAFIVVLTIPFTKETKHHSPPGHKDVSIHQKPLFKAASVCIGLWLLLFTVLLIQ